MDISIKDLFYLYTNGNETVVALRGLHLDVASGECLVIKGPNGSGKSTLVKILTGFFTPSSGKIYIGDQDLTQIDPLRLRREYVASIDQRGNLLSGMTVLENIALAVTLSGASFAESKLSAQALLDSHGLGGIGRRYSGQLSAGERQICSLIAAIATQPKVLIADEPSGELDNDAADKVYQILKSASGETTIILVTHDPRAERIADRVIRMRDGRVSEEWSPGEDEASVIDPSGWMRVREVEQKKRSGKPKSKFKGKRNGPYLIQAQGISLTYGLGALFSDINLDGKSGEIIALSAPSGHGKSSLLRILAGIQDPSTGHVEIEGLALEGLDRESRAAMRAEKIGFLSQGDGAFHRLSLADYLGNLKNSLDHPFGNRMKSSLSNFSGGERARIELLKILAQKKPILILDEPTSQLDENRSNEIVSLIADYAKNGGLVIASTRDESFLERADRILTLS